MSGILGYDPDFQADGLDVPDPKSWNPKSWNPTPKAGEGMPVDLAALREALDRSDGLYPNPGQFLAIESAAREFLRLIETAEPVAYCEEHKSVGEAGSTGCFYNWRAWDLEQDRSIRTPCRMVEAVLTRRDT